MLNNEASGRFNQDPNWNDFCSSSTLTVYVYLQQTAGFWGEALLKVNGFICITDASAGSIELIVVSPSCDSFSSSHKREDKALECKQNMLKKSV